MKKIFFLILSILLLQSCMKIDSNIKIDENGKAINTVKIDISGLNSMQQSIKNMTGSISQTSSNDFCDEKNNSSPKNNKLNYINQTCKKIDENNFIMTSELDLVKEGKGLFSYNSGIYIVDVKELLKDDKNDSSSGINKKVKTEAEQLEELTMMSAMGFKYTIKFELAGKILKSDIGSFSGNIVEIDLIKDSNSLTKNNLYIIAAKEGINIKNEQIKEIESLLKETKINEENKNIYTKQLILSKIALNKSSKNKKYITQIDKLVLNLSKEKGSQLLAKVQKLKKKNDIIKYLESKLYLQINK